MRYLRCEIRLSEYPKRLNRKILVRSDIDLVSFCCAALSSFHATYQYLFHVECADVMYLPLTYLGKEESAKRKYIGDYSLMGTPSPFKLFYGNEENGYQFDCFIRNETEIEKEDIVLIESGNGIGVFEDAKDTLFKYLLGELDPLSKEKMEDGILFPWNINIETLGEFDDPLDIEAENEILSNGIIDDINRFDELDFEYSKEEDDENTIKEDDLDSVLSEQIESLDYVKETYERLEKEFGDERARSLIKSAMLNEVDMMVKEDREFDEERYRNILEKL